MKIALATNGPTLDGEIAVRFGRGTYLLIVDRETLSYRAAPNLYMTLRGEVQPALAQSRSALVHGLSSSVACQVRSTSATLQAWAIQPRGAKGACPSKISLTLPRP